MSRLRLLTPALVILVIASLPACNEKPAEQADGKSATKVEVGTPAADTGAPPPVDTAPPPVDTTGPTAQEGEDESETGEAVEPAPPLPAEFEQVGVAPCDEYVASYVGCITDKVPEAEREAQRRVVFDNITSWKQTAAGGGAAQKSLLTACKIATEQAKRATQDWGCEW
jgi:hypothetical protein